MNKVYLLALALVVALTSYTQSLPLSQTIETTYKKGTRSPTGKPGTAYWQNTADYTLRVKYEPDTRLLSGSVTINYLNNSPDTLRQIWFKLYPNLYKTATPRESKIAARDLGDGLLLDSMWVNNISAAKFRLSLDGTNMILFDQNLVSGERITFRIFYHYTLNRTSHVRTGMIDSNSAFIAYFFPRIAVYDDIDGWNRHPYNGTQEFYNDFCNFNSYVTVPKNFVVWATGDLQNCNEVFTPTYCQRIAQAEKNDAIINIIDSSDNKQNITANNSFNTWHFKAVNVTDFAFALSDHYMWQSSSLVVDKSTGRRTRVDAVFNPKHKDYFWVAADARKTVEAMSYTFPAWPFPYSHETVFDGLDQMEYPMMVNDNPVDNRTESITLTDHEIFHTMFPFYMGINETKYAWMDEGWATIGEWLISPLIDSSIVDDYGVGPTERHLGTEADLPVMSLSTENKAAYFTNSYPEPAMGYLYVKDLLGDALFTKALHYYIKQWNGRHPMPYDFFNCMNAGSGKNLNWFWKRWFFDGGAADLAISNVKPKTGGYSITVTAKGSKPVPIDLTLSFADGSSAKVHRNIGVWEKGAVSVQIDVRSSKKITKVVAGSTWVPDANKSDNTYILQ